jgi:hypothetical protein
MHLHQVVGGDLLWSRKSVQEIYGTFWFVTAQISHPLHFSLALFWNVAYYSYTCDQKLSQLLLKNNAFYPDALSGRKPKASGVFFAVKSSVMESR